MWYVLCRDRTEKERYLGCSREYLVVFTGLHHFFILICKYSLLVGNRLVSPQWVPSAMDTL